MSYSAIIAPIAAIRPIPKADFLVAATVLGYTVVVGKDAQVGDRGVLFPTDGILSDDHCRVNDLYPVLDAEGKRISGGFFDRAKPRVRAQRFRGEKSEGFWQPLSAFQWAGDVIGSMKDGEQFTHLDGHEICAKYETPATKAAQKSGQAKNNRRETPWFRKQPDTTQFRFVADFFFTPGATIYISEKVHGTSQRTGLVLDDANLPLWKRGVNRLFQQEVFPKRAYRLLNGSKNVILEKSTGVGYYGTNDFRYEVIADWAEKIHKGEVVYYEIVGDVAAGSPIMPPCAIPAELKELKAQYGTHMNWRYGCAPGERTIFVYRITRTNEDGAVTELSWNQVLGRCTELGLQPVPSVTVPLSVSSALFGIGMTPSGFKELVEVETDGASLIDPSHIREGIVIRAENADGTVSFAKSKGFAFGVMEGYIKLKDDYVDTEESA